MTCACGHSRLGKGSARSSWHHPATGGLLELGLSFCHPVKSAASRDDTGAALSLRHCPRGVVEVERDQRSRCSPAHSFISRRSSLNGVSISLSIVSFRQA